MDNFLVLLKDDEDSYPLPVVRTKARIISNISMFDCSPYSMYRVYAIKENGDLVPLKIYGTWHNPKDPLYIKLEDPEGNIVFDGHGTDH